MTDTDASLLADRLEEKADELFATDRAYSSTLMREAAAALRRSGEALRRLQEEIKQLPRDNRKRDDGEYDAATVRLSDVLEVLSRQSGAEGTE